MGIIAIIACHLVPTHFFALGLIFPLFLFQVLGFFGGLFWFFSFPRSPMIYLGDNTQAAVFQKMISVSM